MKIKINSTIMGLGLLLFSPFLLISNSNAQSQFYNITDLGTLGGSTTFPGPVNELGQTAGASATFNGLHAYLWQDGVMQDLGTPNGNGAEATGLNESGQIVGFTEGQGQIFNAYFWENGTWTSLGTLPGSGLDLSYATDINNNGKIAGYSFNYYPDFNDRAWMWYGGEFTDLGTLGGTDSRALAINEMDQIVGWTQISESSNETHGFLWEAGNMTDLGILPYDVTSVANDINNVGQVCGTGSHPSGTYGTSTSAWIWENGTLTELPPYSSNFTLSAANAINDLGQIVGYFRYTTVSGAEFASLWENGTAVNLNDRIPAGSGWDLVYATDINNAGQITAWGQAPDGQYRACLLTPASDLTVSLTPSSSPIVIPANGGEFGFDIEVANNSVSPQTIDIWTIITLPNGNQYGPIINVSDFNAPAEWSAERYRTQVVPDNAPAGSYTYDAYVGYYPDVIIDEDHFNFEKSTVSDGDGYFGSWFSSGEDFEQLRSDVTVLPTDYGISAYPNPFNPKTNIQFALQQAENIKLQVYSVTGSLVATLADGYHQAGAHEVSFDASSLTSGIYFARLDYGNQSQVQKLMLVK
jgi:probable HAF family extracellular repeat protein